jgi:prepilin-type N-terminal cleavage/methylation domain-containing protein
VKRLKAFTLTELLIVMIISVITLTTIYTVYLLVKKQYLKQSAKSESLNNYLLFKNTFANDFNNADSVKNTAENQSLLCYFDSVIINYTFSEKVVTRQFNDLTDSFYVFPGNLDAEVVENSELVSKVSFNIVPYKDTVMLLYSKQYDAASLIKIKIK